MSFSCSHVSESLTCVTKEGEHSRWEAPRSWLPSTPPPPSLPAPVPSRPGLSQVPDSHVLRPSCTCPPPGQSDAIRTLLASLPCLRPPRAFAVLCEHRSSLAPSPSDRSAALGRAGAHGLPLCWDSSSCQVHAAPFPLCSKSPGPQHPFITIPHLPWFLLVM